MTLSIFIYSRDTRRPLIRFCNGIERIIMNEAFSINSGGKIICQRTQLPLDLGSFRIKIKLEN